eukprot:6723289-Pyramimonas_sp.AAC.1
MEEWGRRSGSTSEDEDAEEEGGNEGTEEEYGGQEEDGAQGQGPDKERGEQCRRHPPLISSPALDWAPGRWALDPSLDLTSTPGPWTLDPSLKT